MEPDVCAKILDKVKVALSGFDGSVHHGQIVIHIGEADWELEVSRRHRKEPIVVVTSPPKWSKK